MERVRTAEARRAPLDHPGPLDPERLDASLLDGFTRHLEAAGGEVVVPESTESARAWLAEFAADFACAAVSPLVPDPLRPALPAAEPADAALGVSLASHAVAETGSLLLEGREGRALQLLPPTLLVWVRRSTLVATLSEALGSRPDPGQDPTRPGPGDPRLATRDSLAFHSGPSKSADIGGMLVRGVHGPGRLIAAVVD